MAKDFDIGLKSKLRLFSQKFEIEEGIDETKLFESFSNYVILSNFLNEDFDDPNSLSTGLSQGIDGIGIIINNNVIKDESDLDKIGENEKINVRIIFIQSTIQSSFSIQKFQSFIDSCIDFLLNNQNIEPFSDIINKIFNEENRFINQMEETPSVSILFSSGKTNHGLSEHDILSQENKIKQREDFNFQFNLKEINVLQYEELKSYYDKIEKYLEVLIELNSEMDINEKDKVPLSLISILKFSELKKVIATEDGDGFIRDKIFVENVRAKIIDSDVNNDILKTLQNNDKRPYFLYMNNGITILCEGIRRHEVSRSKVYLKHPRIINGCQTSNMLYDYYQTNPEEANEVELVAKIISTIDSELKKDIIYATNNQNAIDKDLETLNDFHTKLEDYFIGRDSFGLMYERLRGQYSEVFPKYKVLNKETIAKSYISIFKSSPHLMKSNATSRIEKYIINKDIFSQDNDNALEEYYYSGVLYYLLQKNLSNNNIQLKSKTMDMHLLLAIHLTLEKKEYNTTSSKLSYLSNNENSSSLFTTINKSIEEQEFLFERRGFYSGPKTRLLIEYLNNES